MHTIDPRQLDAITLFRALDETQRQLIIGSTRRILLQEGERLFDRGQQAERFYLVISGQIKLFRLSESGNEKIVEIMGPGKLFAEAVMFLPERRYPVSSAALVDSEVYGFDMRLFLGLLQDSNQLCFRMLGDLSFKLHHLINEIDSLTLQNATLRVIHFLLGHIDDRDAESAVIELPAPKYGIAARLSITPETLSRILHGMERDGLLRIEGAQITVINVDHLRDYHRQSADQRIRAIR